MAAETAVVRCCAACGADTLDVRFSDVRDPDSGESFEVLSCTVCGAGRTWPQPADLGRYYTAAYHGGRHGFTDRYCQWRRQRLVEAVCAGQVGEALDIGCGDGTFLLQLKARGWKTAGTELRPERARQAGLEVATSLGELGARGPFGLITLWHSLEHLADPRAVLAAAQQLLAPDGVLLVAVPDADSPQARTFGAAWVHLDVPRHLHHFGPKSLSRLLTSSGLVPFGSWNHELEIDVFGWAQSALNLLLPEPNVLFKKLTGRATNASTPTVVASFGLGAVLSAAALPVVAAGNLMNNAGTLVMAARRS